MKQVIMKAAVKQARIAVIVTASRVAGDHGGGEIGVW